MRDAMGARMGVVGIVLSLGPTVFGQTEAGLHKDNVIVVDGVERTYDYYVPTTLPAGKAVPLALLLHGHGGDADTMTGESGTTAPFRMFMDIAERDPFIVVFPEGTIGPDGQRGWNDCRGDATTNPRVDDIAFMNALLDQLEATFMIDAERIHAAGMSNGAFMALRIGAEMGERVKSVAAVCAALPARPECGVPEVPVSVMLMSGTDDPLVPWEGGPVGGRFGGERGAVLSARESVERLIQFDGTQREPTVVDVPDTDRGDGSTVRRYTFEGGRQGTRVVMYAVTGGGHTEPSERERYSALWELVVGNQNHDFEMAEAVWGFFEGR